MVWEWCPNSPSTTNAKPEHNGHRTKKRKAICYSLCYGRRASPAERVCARNVFSLASRTRTRVTFTRNSHLKLVHNFSQRPAACTLVLSLWLCADSLIIFYDFHNESKLFELLIWPSNDCHQDSMCTRLSIPSSCTRVMPGYARTELLCKNGGRDMSVAIVTFDEDRMPEHL